MFPSKIYKFKTNFEYPTVVFELAHLALIWLVMNIHLVYKTSHPRGNMVGGLAWTLRARRRLNEYPHITTATIKQNAGKSHLSLKTAEEKMLRWKKRPKRKELQRNEQNKRFFFCSLCILVLFFSVQLKCNIQFVLLDLSGILQNVKKGYEGLHHHFFSSRTLRNVYGREKASEHITNGLNVL